MINSSQDFLALIDSFNLKQHVCSPTHHAGHILDLLITRDDDQLVTSVSIHDAAFSDHFVVNCALSMEKPSFTRKQIIYRSFKNFDIDLFISDVRGFDKPVSRQHVLKKQNAFCNFERNLVI